MRAAEKGDSQRLQALIAARADVNLRDAAGDTALILAAGEGDSADCVRMLIAAGADINAKGDSDDTALLWAAANNNAANVRALLAAGAEVHTRGKNGETALIWASASASNAVCVRALINAHADVNAKDMGGNTAVMEAEDAECIRALVEAGADVNARNSEGWTALLRAQNLECVRALITAGADVNAKNNDGRTALMHFAYMGNAECVQALVDAKADSDEVNSDGRRAINYAEKKDRTPRLVAAVNRRVYAAIAASSQESQGGTDTRMVVHMLELLGFGPGAEFHRGDLDIILKAYSFTKTCVQKDWIASQGNAVDPNMTLTEPAQAYAYFETTFTEKEKLLLEYEIEGKKSSHDSIRRILLKDAGYDATGSMRMTGKR
jgi:ankyrin repeat protein